MLPIEIDPSQGQTRRQMQQHLAARNIHTRPLWQPLHLSAAMADCASKTTGVAEQLQQNVLCLPSSANLTIENQQRVIDAIVDCLQARAAA